MKKGKFILYLKRISKIYQTGSKKKKALDDISINFRSNEFVSILGQSGSRKTTMLNIIGDLDNTPAGTWLLMGSQLKNLRTVIGMLIVITIFQSYNLIVRQTAVSNVEMLLTLSGVSKVERHQRALVNNPEILSATPRLARKLATASKSLQMCLISNLSSSK